MRSRHIQRRAHLLPVANGGKGEMTVVADETVPNGPEVTSAVDRLVIASVANMPLPTAAPVPETVQ